eukprot:9429610-Alexandrium_andersonii.AAC.1
MCIRDSPSPSRLPPETRPSARRRARRRGRSDANFYPRWAITRGNVLAEPTPTQLLGIPDCALAEGGDKVHPGA